VTEHEEPDEARALIQMSRSADYKIRADAARRLAHFAVDAAAAHRLRQLILDADDTMVTFVATTALIARGDAAGLAIVASALAVADENQLDWIDTGVGDGLNRSESARQHAMRICSDLATRHPDESVRRGASLLDPLLGRAGLA